MENKPIEIKTKRLVLKSFSESDLDKMCDILTNEEIKKTFMIPDYEKREQVEDLFHVLKKLSFDPLRFVYGIFLNEKVIGFIDDVDIKDDTIELGYVIEPMFRGNAYAPEALKASIDELFKMGYNHVKAGYFEENLASKRVMEKVGMHKTNQTEEIEYQGFKHHCIIFQIDKE